MNLYQCCNSNPASYVDVTGEEPITLTTALLLIAAGIIVYEVLDATVFNPSVNAMHPVHRMPHVPGAYVPELIPSLDLSFPAMERDFFQNIFCTKSEKSIDPKLPNQGNVQGNVENGPDVDAGKQGKHVQGHPNHQEDKSTWKQGNGVDDTQEAWLNGKELPDGTKVWDAGRVTGTKGETGVRVHTDQNGIIHGYPVDPGRYLLGQ